MAHPSALTKREFISKHQQAGKQKKKKRSLKDYPFYACLQRAKLSFTVEEICHDHHTTSAGIMVSSISIRPS